MITAKVGKSKKICLILALSMILVQFAGITPAFAVPDGGGGAPLGISQSTLCDVSVYGNVYDAGIETYSSAAEAVYEQNPDYYLYYPGQQIKLDFAPKTNPLASVQIYDQGILTGDLTVAAGVYSYTYRFPNDFSSTEPAIVLFGVTNNIGQQETLTFAVIPNVTLPPELGGSTTDFTKVEDFTNTDLVFEVPDYGMITFTEPLNLTDSGVVKQLSHLGDGLYFEGKEIGIDKTYMAGFNLPARLTLYNLNLASGTDSAACQELLSSFEFNGSGIPNIPNERGALEAGSVVFTDGGVKPDSLTFDVGGFSTYTIKPGLVVDRIPTPIKGIVAVSGSVSDLSTAVA
ncbi:MAG: hypothetical protein ACYC21_10770, partial [Eubacteriales bacterium]